VIKFVLWIGSVAASVWGGCETGFTTGNLLLGAILSALAAAIVTVLYMITFKILVVPTPPRTIAPRHRLAGA
jgi:multisubunit Na+/H+ antiporter MnhE subunit